MPLHTRRRSRAVLQPVFHTGRLRKANNHSRKVPTAFKTKLIKTLLSIRDAPTPPPPYTTTASGGTESVRHARADFAFQAGCKMGLQATHGGIPHTVTIQRHDHPAQREILIQLIHTPKCAGTYFKQQILRKLALPQPPERKGIFPRCFRLYSNVHRCTFVFVNGHVPARNFSPHSIRLGMIREPFRRLQSAFYYLCHGASDINPRGQKVVKYDWDTQWRALLQRYPDFTSFLADEAIAKRALSINRGKEHFFPLTYWLCDAKHRPIVDLVIRQEHFADDVDRLFVLLGIELPTQNESRVNVARKTPPKLSPVEKNLCKPIIHTTERCMKRWPQTNGTTPNGRQVRQKCCSWWMPCPHSTPNCTPHPLTKWHKIPK